MNVLDFITKILQQINDGELPTDAKIIDTDSNEISSFSITEDGNISLETDDEGDED